MDYQQTTMLEDEPASPNLHTIRGGLVSASYLCEVTGATYRQIDYWCRLGVITPHQPADGSGSQRGFHATQVPPIAAMAQLALMGASADMLRAAYQHLTNLEVHEWRGMLYVTPAGHVTHRMTSPVAIALNLDRTRAACIAWNAIAQVA